MTTPLVYPRPTKWSDSFCCRYRCVKNVSKRLIRARFRPSPLATARKLMPSSAVLSGRQRSHLAHPEIQPSDQTVGSSSLSERAE